MWMSTVNPGKWSRMWLEQILKSRRTEGLNGVSSLKGLCRLLVQSPALQGFPDCGGGTWGHGAQWSQRVCPVWMVWDTDILIYFCLHKSHPRWTWRRNNSNSSHFSPGWYEEMTPLTEKIPTKLPGEITPPSGADFYRSEGSEGPTPQDSLNFCFISTAIRTLNKRFLKGKALWKHLLLLSGTIRGEWLGWLYLFQPGVLKKRAKSQRNWWGKVPFACTWLECHEWRSSCSNQHYINALHHPRTHGLLFQIQQNYL